MFVFLCQLVDRLTPWKIERQTTQALLFDTPPVFSYVALLKTKQCYFSKMKIVGYYLESSVAAFEIIYILSTYSIKTTISLLCSSHMSGALDGTEKSKAQKLGHPMLVQPILSQKNQKSKFFNDQFFCN